MKGYKQRRKPTTKEVLNAQFAAEMRVGQIQQQMSILDDALSYIIAHLGIDLLELRKKYQVIREQDGRLVLSERNDPPTAKGDVDETQTDK